MDVMISVRCPQCDKIALKASGAVNRARKIGAPIYCGRICAGLGRRKGKTSKQLKAEKAAYDRRLRAVRGYEIRAKKRAAFARDYDPDKASIYRRCRMHLHVAYCQRPEYRAWKQEYDRRYRANNIYGPFAEAYLALFDVEREVAARATDYEIRMMNDTINKAHKRKVQYAQSTGQQADRR